MYYSDFDGCDDRPMPYRKPAKVKTVEKGCPENDGKAHVYVDLVKRCVFRDGTPYEIVRFECVCGHKPNYKTYRRLLKEYKAAK